MDVSPTDESSAGDMASGAAISLLGKAVRVREKSVLYSAQPGETALFKVNTGTRNNAVVELRDRSDNLVAMMNTAVDGIRDTDGAVIVAWDGRGLDGQSFVGAGNYRIRVVGEEDDPTLYAFSDGTVDGITMFNGAPRIRVNGRVVSFSDIIDIAATQRMEDTRV
jgi:flagellar hook assembly protein FlgD